MTDKTAVTGAVGNRPVIVEVWHCEQPDRYVVTDDWFDMSTEPVTRHVYAAEARPSQV